MLRHAPQTKTGKDRCIDKPFHGPYYTPSQEAALYVAVREVWLRFADIHWRLSVYHPRSDLNRINQSYPNAVAIDLLRATVIAPSAEFSDFWSTVLCVLEPHRGIELIDALGEWYASMVVVDEGNGKLIKKASRNYEKYRSREPIGR